MMKRLQSLILVALCGIFLASCGGGTEKGTKMEKGSPKWIVTEISNYSMKGDYAKMAEKFLFEYSGKEMLKEIESLQAYGIDKKTLIASFVEEMKEEAERVGGIKSFVVSDERREGDVAFVEVTYTFGNGDTSSETFEFAKEDGKWKLVDAF
jgi:hypothetical protein